jgi:hypothetical protein
VADIAVVSGYVVRCPLAGYAWQALHYLAGLRALGFAAYFYEDTAYYGDCFDPVSGEMGPAQPSAIAFAQAFFARHGWGDRWIFWDAQRDRYSGLDRAAAHGVLADARLVLGLAAVNRLPRDVGTHRVFVDLDPAVTQIEAGHDRNLAGVLDEYDVHFTIGENIGTPGCAVPAGRWTWHPTRPPIDCSLWTPQPSAADAVFTTIGRWDERRRVQQLGGETYSWSKRDEWLRFVDLPGRTGARFELAMDVDKNPGDRELLGQHGWAVVDPLALSTDAEAYRGYICRSLGEFTVAKQLNVRLATGWFSDRSACYLAAGRPVVVQDTGFGTTLPTGAGLLAFSTPEEAADAIIAVTDAWAVHSAAARRIAERYFAARTVLADLLDRAGV